VLTDRLCNIIVLIAQAPTEDQSDDSKDSLYVVPYEHPLTRLQSKCRERNRQLGVNCFIKKRAVTRMCEREMFWHAK